MEVERLERLKREFDATLPCAMTIEEFARLPFALRVRKINGESVDLQGFQGIYIYKNSKGINAYRRVKTIGSPLPTEVADHERRETNA